MQDVNPIHRAKAALGGLVIAAAALSFVVSTASAGPAGPSPAAGTIHVYLVNTSLNPNAANDILITGSFSDHAPARRAFGTLPRALSPSITVRSSPLSSRRPGAHRTRRAALLME